MYDMIYTNYTCYTSILMRFPISSDEDALFMFNLVELFAVSARVVYSLRNVFPRVLALIQDEKTEKNSCYLCR